MANKCPHCGERVSPKDEYCPMCDYRLKKAKNRILEDTKLETAAEQYSCKKVEHKEGNHSINLHGNETKAEQYSCRKDEHKYTTERKVTKTTYTKSKEKKGLINALTDLSKTDEVLGKVIATALIGVIFHIPGWILSAIVVYNYVRYSPALTGKPLKNGEFITADDAKERIRKAMKIELVFAKIVFIIFLVGVAATVLGGIITAIVKFGELI